MQMKVLEPGKVPTPVKPWPIGEVVSCASCGCKWEIETNNDYISVRSNGGPYGPNTIACTCPTCRKQVRFEDKRKESDGK